MTGSVAVNVCCSVLTVDCPSVCMDDLLEAPRRSPAGIQRATFPTLSWESSGPELPAGPPAFVGTAGHSTQMCPFTRGETVAVLRTVYHTSTSPSILCQAEGRAREATLPSDTQPRFGSRTT